jgi:hypothetical protein
MRGVALLARKTFEDMRGRLHALEAFDNLPFVPQRVFLIEVQKYVGARGGHANSCAEVIVALRGSVTVEMYNGEQTENLRLLGGDEPLWISAGVVIKLTDFEAGSLLLVCASERYARTQHFLEPQPHLIADSPSMP